MVRFKDVDDIILPEGSHKFDYLLAVCEREKFLLEKEKRNKEETFKKGEDDKEFDEYYLGGGHVDEDMIKVTNILENPSTGKDDGEREVVIANNILDQPKQASDPTITKIIILEKPLSMRMASKATGASSPEEEERKKRLMGSCEGSCLSLRRIVIKSLVQDSTSVPSTTRSNAKDSVVSSSSEGNKAVATDHQNSPSKRKRERLRYDQSGREAAAEMINSKKRKKGNNNNCNREVPNNGPEPPPGLPVEFRNKILQLAGNRAVSVEKLVIQKILTETDVSSAHNRLSIPARLVKEMFLTDEEQILLSKHNGKKVCSMDGVPFITPLMEEATVSLRRWEMRKERGVPSVSYVIANTWNKVRERNDLESGMMIQLWAIRVDGDLWLALVRLPDN